jgi:hypothetical protein
LRNRGEASRSEHPQQRQKIRNFKPERQIPVEASQGLAPAEGTAQQLASLLGNAKQAHANVHFCAGHGQVDSRPDQQAAQRHEERREVIDNNYF